MELRSFGYSQVLAYDPVNGFRVVPLPGESTDAGDRLLGQLGLTVASGVAPAGLELFAATLERCVAHVGEPLALVVDFASRFVVRTDSLSQTEHQAFTRALVASHSTRPRPYGTSARPFFNTVFWIADKEGDLPDWMLVGNPRLRHIPIARPDHIMRRPFAAALLRSVGGFKE